MSDAAIIDGAFNKPVWHLPAQDSQGLWSALAALDAPACDLAQAVTGRFRVCDQDEEALPPKPTPSECRPRRAA